MKPNQASPDSPVALETFKRIGGGPKPTWRKWLKYILLFVFISALVVIGFSVFRTRTSQASQPKYEYGKVSRGDLKVTVSATGTIESVGAVEIGAEISGRVDEVFVEFNDQVKKGQVLAQINTSQLAAKLKETKAQFQVANAGVLSAQATVDEASAKADRLKGLAARGLSSAQDLEIAVAAQKRAIASLATARAQSAVSAASLESAQSSIDKATIRSPVDGVVLSRSISTGQTVAASFTSPVLFTVARDLTSMKLLVDIDEADVGTVKDGQPAVFSVDAYPKREFPAILKAIKNVPTSGKDVVTYSAELTVDNTERLLRPGMTATATITTESRSQVLLVPNSALRFRPPETAFKMGIPGMGPPPPGGGGPPGLPGAPAPAGAGKSTAAKTTSSSVKPQDGAKVWILRQGALSPIIVNSGASDGANSEVSSDQLREGMELVTGLLTEGT